ncbi:MAG: undecaprenyl/decaprenyl-phosphate alpha-N-acetylglucosaminyl 1-phosphate transferase [Chloroflexi bacterium]|nr:undecaprenyl/decaprenyl-phosphate alpha-N-acetylglucosaminyl 1-phosphate transferase [Chloroflexota bacterium]
MSFPFNLYLLAFVWAGLTSGLTMPWWRSWCAHQGLVDDPGHRKIHETPVPLAGGLAVMTGLAVPLLMGVLTVCFTFFALKQMLPDGAFPSAASLAGLDLNTLDLLRYGLSRRGVQLLAILLGALGMVILGWLDDKHELSPGLKFGGQLCIATLVAASGIRITLFVESTLFSYLVTVLWILTVTNALNFMDNMNGLCAGLGVIAAWCFAWSAAVHGQYLVALIAFQSCGALLGFLPFNFPKASAFLGDAGSHLVGYVLAVLAILPHFYSSTTPNVWAVLSPLLILAVPLGDLAWVVALRWKLGQPFYVGDTNHLSHRLVRRGCSRSAAVVLIWLLAAAGGALALMVLQR